ncbi:uncharacterized protein [Solanum tuberosum]|uniref:uncharacterized protein n=1 Tax=Solanum tuberosum TaxID=4113 RepID=UPI00073A166D|nr:PREDICTED: uncharacterized protein LOC107058927 [Solanum tuberosum]
MAENGIEEMLDHLRRIKSGGNLTSFKIDQIQKFEMWLRVLRTFIKYHHVLFRDSLFKHTKNAKLTMEMLHRVLDEITDQCKTNPNLERLESHLLEFLKCNTILSYNYELNDLDLSKYMDFLEKNLTDLVMISLEEVRSYPAEQNLEIHRFIKQLKIVQKKMKILRYLYATEINGYVGNEKLECLETRIQFMVNNVGQLCFAISDNVFADFVDKDEDDILNKHPYLLFLIVLVELEMKKIFLDELKASMFTHSRTFKDKKLPKGSSHHLQNLLMYLGNKKLNNFLDNVSVQNIDVAIEFFLVFLDDDVSNHDSLIRKLNEMSVSESDLDFLMKPLLGNLEKELSTLISILEKELSSLSSIFRDVAKVHHKHKILKDLKRRTINLAYEAEVTEIWSADVALKPFYVVAPFKHLLTRHSNPVIDEEIVGCGNDIEKMILYLIKGTNELDVIPIVGMGGQGKTTIARKVYNSENIVSHFDVRAWCIISKTYNRRTLLEEIFSRVTGYKDKRYKDDILTDMLRKSLVGKRYLILLDVKWDYTPGKFWTSINSKDYTNLTSLAHIQLRTDHYILLPNH